MDFHEFSRCPRLHLCATEVDRDRFSGLEDPDDDLNHAFTKAPSHGECSRLQVLSIMFFSWEVL